jgi:hypothetical protein
LRFALDQNEKTLTWENVMNSRLIRNALLVSVLAGFCLALGCGAHVDGTYKDSDGAVTLTLKAGKATIDFGPVHIDASYAVSGNKLTLTPLQGDTSQTLVFTIDSDGSLEAQGTMFPKLLKQK